MSDKNIQTLDEETADTEPLESGPVQPLASTEDGTLIKDFPLATTVNDNDDMIIETDVPQTEHCKAQTFKDYVIKDALLSMYPVGAIYISTVSTSPASLFGGTWAEIQNRFLVAAGSSYTAGSTGGSATATLSSSNLPSHTHSLPSHTHSLPSHTHSLPSHTHSLPSHTHSLPSHTHSLPSHTHSVSIPSHTHSIPSLSGTAASAGAHTHTVNYDDSTMASGSNYDRYRPSGSAGSRTFTNSAGAHTHSVTTNSSTTGSYSGSVTSGSTSGTSGSQSGTSGSASGTSGSTSGTSGSTSGTSGSTSGTSGATGSGSSFSIVPPYMAVYMWQRTA